MDPASGAERLLASGDIAVIALTTMVGLLVVALGFVWKRGSKAQDDLVSMMAARFDADMEQNKVDLEMSFAMRDMTRVVDGLATRIEGSRR